MSCPPGPAWSEGIISGTTEKLALAHEVGDTSTWAQATAKQSHRQVGIAVINRARLSKDMCSAPMNDAVPNQVVGHLSTPLA